MWDCDNTNKPVVEKLFSRLIDLYKTGQLLMSEILLNCISVCERHALYSDYEYIDNLSTSDEATKADVIQSISPGNT